MAHDILVVDDESDIAELVCGILEDEGHTTRSASSAEAALEQIAARRPSMVFLDIWLQGSKLDGLAVLDRVHADHPELPVVMISGHGNIETAVSAIQRGAYDYVEKPFKADRLVLVAERALERQALQRQVRELSRKSLDSPELIGKSVPMNQLRSVIERVSPTNSRILLSGPGGSGKELVARTIHRNSPRASRPFVVVNAGAIGADTMEQELFGVEAPEGRRIGALEEAHGGTLFLNEIADMPHDIQSRLLRFLTDQSFVRKDGQTRVKVDVRIISSTSRDLESEIEAGTFRADVFHRLAVMPVRVPALAERRDDIPLLIEHFMSQLALTSGLAPRSISDDAMAVLQSHDWPGNIRQLRNNVERLMILSGDAEGPVTADMLPEEVGTMLPKVPTEANGAHLMSLPLREAREIFEREYLIAQVNRFNGNVSRTAEFVGMERSALHRKLKSLGVS